MSSRAVVGARHDGGVSDNRIIPNFVVEVTYEDDGQPVLTSGVTRTEVAHRLREVMENLREGESATLRVTHLGMRPRRT